MHSSLKISIAGSGKVARAFSLAFKDAGLSIAQIISRNTSSGAELAQEIGASHVTLNDIIENVDLIAVLVSDDAISEVSSALPRETPQFHASGVTRFIDMRLLYDRLFSVARQRLNAYKRATSHTDATHITRTAYNLTFV